MSPFSKQRSTGRHARHANRLRLAASGGAFSNHSVGARFVHAAVAANLPGLSMPEPEDRTRLLVSSAISALLHLLVIGGIAIVGYVAKQAVEEIIPVTILNKPIELPGSNEPSRLPVPKMLSAPIANPAPLAMDPTVLAAVPAPIIEAPNLDTAAPKALDLAQVTSAALAAIADISPTPSAADIRQVQPLEISAADLVAPKVELSGPTQTAERSATDLAAPSAFESLSDLDASQYKGAVAAVPIATGGLESGGAMLATGIAAEYLAPGFAGGDPNAMGTVDCMQSAFVVRYLDDVKNRTHARWEIPITAGADDYVQLLIGIDRSGALVFREFVDSSDQELAESAIRALESASPFPPLNDNNRCLTEKRFRTTFTP